MKYVIIPTVFESEAIEASSPEEALVNFATGMETDMNIYFRAVPEGHVEAVLKAEKYEAHKDFVKEWMRSTLITDFDIDEQAAGTLSEFAYDRYCEGNGETEYEAVEWAVENNPLRWYVSNIDWDTDEETDCREDNLPKEVYIDLLCCKNQNEVEDYLSDNYNFCVKSFLSELVFQKGGLA